jgi:hypothetical protein
MEFQDLLSIDLPERRGRSQGKKRNRKGLMRTKVWSLQQQENERALEKMKISAKNKKNNQKSAGKERSVVERRVSNHRSSRGSQDRTRKNI